MNFDFFSDIHQLHENHLTTTPPKKLSAPINIESIYLLLIALISIVLICNSWDFW